MRESKKHAFHWLWFARKLAEYYVISVENRVERNELNYQYKHQETHNYRSMPANEFYKALQDKISKLHPGAKLGKVITMPRTFAGSNRYYQEKYANLMRIAQEYGNPTW